MQIDLSSNRLCGAWMEYDKYNDDFVQKGTYTAEGIKAIADALSVSTSMTSLK